MPINRAALERTKRKKKKREAAKTAAPPKTAKGHRPESAGFEPKGPDKMRATNMGQYPQYGGAIPPQQEVEPQKWDEEKYGKPVQPVIPGLVPDPTTDALNLHNLSLAWFDKFKVYPTAKQARAMLQATPRVWTRAEWFDMIKPLDGAHIPRPLIAEYTAYTNSVEKPRGPATIGASLGITNVGMGLQGFKVDHDMIYDPPSMFGGAFAWSTEDPAAGYRPTPDPEWAELPEQIRVLNKEARQGISRMSYQEIQYFEGMGGGILGYKKFLANTLRNNNKPVTFDPNTTEWDKNVNQAYHKYLFGRLMSYAILSKDPAIKAQAVSIMAQLYPKILGKDMEDMTGVSTEILTTGVTNLGETLRNAGLDSNATIINACYNGFIDGRIPGQTIRNARYDYVEEFGVDALPANAYKEYNDDTFTLQGIIGTVFNLPVRAGDAMSEELGKVAEATDWLFDRYKDSPGATGIVADTLHTVHEKMFTTLNPMVGPFKLYEGFGMVLGLGMTTLTTVVDVLASLDVTGSQPRDKLQTAYNEYIAAKARILSPMYANATPEYREQALKELDEEYAKTGLLGGVDPEALGEDVPMKQLLSIHMWADRWKNQQYTGPFNALVGQAGGVLGMETDSGAFQALNTVGELADFYVILKVAGALDKGGRKVVVKGSRKAWDGMKFLRDRERGPKDLGAEPTNPNALKPIKYRAPKGAVNAEGKKIGGQVVSAEYAYEQGWYLRPFDPARAGTQGAHKGSNKPPTGQRGPSPRQHHIPFNRGPEEFGGEGPGGTYNAGGGRAPSGRTPKSESEFQERVDRAPAEIDATWRIIKSEERLKEQTRILDELREVEKATEGGRSGLLFGSMTDVIAMARSAVQDTLRSALEERWLNTDKGKLYDAQARIDAARAPKELTSTQEQANWYSQRREAASAIHLLLQERTPHRATSFEALLMVEEALKKAKPGTEKFKTEPSIRRDIYRGSMDAGELAPEPPTWVSADKYYANRYAQHGVAQGEGVSRFFIDPGAKVMETTSKKAWVNTRAFVDIAREKGFDVVHVVDKNEYIIVNKGVVHPKAYGAKAGKGETEVVPRDNAEVLIHAEHRLREVDKEIKDMEDFYGVAEERRWHLTADANRGFDIKIEYPDGKAPEKIAPREDWAPMDRKFVESLELEYTDLMKTIDATRKNMGLDGGAKGRGFPPREEMHLSDEPGAASIGPVPNELPFGTAWGVPKEDYALFNEFAKLPSKGPITAEHVSQMLDNMAVNKTVKRMILDEMGPTPDNVTLAGLAEMIRRFRDEATYDARHAPANASSGVGAMIADLRGQRAAITRELAEYKIWQEDIARVNREDPYGMKYTKEEIQKYVDEGEAAIEHIDTSLHALNRVEGGGFPAMLGRILEIDNEILRIQRNVRKRLQEEQGANPGEAFEVSFEKIEQRFKDEHAKIDELLAERSNIAHDHTYNIEDLPDLGGEFRAYRTEYPVKETKTAAEWKAEHERLQGLKKKGMDVDEQLAEVAEDYHNARKAETSQPNQGGGAYQPYAPADLNRAPGRPPNPEWGEGPAMGEHQRTGPSKGGGRKRADIPKDMNVAFELEPFTMKEWQDLCEGKEVRGVTLKELMKTVDAVALEQGTYIYDKTSKKFVAAEMKAARGESVVPPKTTKETAEKAAEKEAATPPEGPPPAEQPVKTGGKKEPHVGSDKWRATNMLDDVAEWIAQFTHPGDKNFPLIQKVLGLKDDPKLHTPLINKLRKANTKDEVLHLLAEAKEKQGIVVEDVLGPAFMRLGKVQMFEKSVDAALKIPGPIGEHLAGMIRTFGAKVPLAQNIDEIGSPDAIREMGTASKMGRKVVDREVMERIRYWEQEMAIAVGGGARRKVAARFESEIMQNMGYVSKNGVDVSPKNSEWAKYQKMHRRITRSQAAGWLKKTSEAQAGFLVDPHNRAYSLNDSVLPARKELHREIKNTEALRDSAIERGDTAKAESYQKALDLANTKFKEYDAACKVFIKLAEKPYEKMTKAEKEAFDAAEKTLDNMGSAQPVWEHQLTHSINFKINHRHLAWYQSGRPASKYMKFDTIAMDKPVRLWKQWAMFGFGFPIRVYLGDEIWRIPMEGYGIQSAIQALAATRMLEGKLPGWSPKHPFTKSDKAKYKELEAKKRTDKLTESEQAELDLLKQRQIPMGNEFTEKWLNDTKADMDWANDASDSFDILSPTLKMVGRERGGTKEVWEVPNDPLYLPAVKHVIQKLGDEMAIRALLKEATPDGGWTYVNTVEFLNKKLMEAGKEGDAFRQFCLDTGRITAPMLNVRNMRKALSKPTGGTYRNIYNIVGEWADMWIKVERSPILLKGVKDRYITIDDLNVVDGKDLFSVPVVRRIGAEGSPTDYTFLNIPSKIYNGVHVPGLNWDVGTLPFLTWIGTKVRDVLFGSKYNEELAKIGVKLEDYKDDPAAFKVANEAASRRAAQIAADFTEKATFTRNATIFEDMARNQLPFINSYRQFMVYWGKKMVTRPFTMDAIWQYAPEIPILYQLGPLQVFASGMQPFFTQPDGQDGRTPGLEGLLGGVFGSTPSTNFATNAFLGYAIREFTDTRADLSGLPFMGGQSKSLAPLGKVGQWVEGMVGVPENLKGNVFKDDTTTHMAWNSALARWTEIPTGSLGERELGMQKLPFPANVLKFLEDKVGVHNTNALFQAASGTLGLTMRYEDDVTAAYDQESIKHKQLMQEGKYREAAEFLSGSEVLGPITEIRQSNDPKYITDMKIEHPELMRILAGRYDWTTDGQFLYSTDWTREARNQEENHNNLRNEWITVWGGVPFDANGTPLKDQMYGGDINRPKAERLYKKQLVKIDNYMRKEAKRIANGNARYEQNLIDEFKRKGSSYIVNSKHEEVPDYPTWYRAALQRDGLWDTDAQNWHPGEVTKNFTGFYGTQSRATPYQPTEENMEVVSMLGEAGLLSPDLVEQVNSPFSKWGTKNQEAEEKTVREWRLDIVDIAEQGWYDMDSRVLNRIGYNIPDPDRMDDVILDVRAKYYEWKAIGDKYGTQSKEYRAGRNNFYAYKDAAFKRVPGGEIFVGGLPNRIMHMPWLVSNTFVFTGDDAARNQKIWRTYLEEAQQEKPDMKVLNELKTHWNKELADKTADWNAMCEWAYVVGAAQYMRYVMKNSWSDYYQGPGNSVYTKQGENFVSKLEHMIQSYQKDDASQRADERSKFNTDIRRYFGDAHSLAYKLLEWYMH